MQVPFLDLRTQFKSLRDEIIPAVTDIMERGAFVGGPALADFEKAFAEFCGADFAVGCGNGTDALQLALRAGGIGVGDEVITAANTFVATVEAIALTGATPVLVDMDPATYHLDISQIEAAITPKTRAIIPVHLYGDPVDMDPILEIARRKFLLVIEDSAQSHGATYHGRPCGSMGDISGFSFYPGKNLGAYGDGGAITTSRDDLAQMVRQIGDHGSPKKFTHDKLGTNSRLDAIQAVVLKAKLGHIKQWNENRRAIAATYREHMGDIDGLFLPEEREGHKSVYHLYVIRSAKVKDIDEALKKADIGFGYHYPVPVHLQDAFKHLGEPGRFPEAEKGAREILSLPMFPEMSKEQAIYVAQTVRSAI
ncbi:MAG: DegT/DnrJ/EryC1/StrS family aminotransferase [bacterium]|nr:DegT/DnrJ/EryC1/StrS family aminotransferase [bacterium]